MKLETQYSKLLGYESFTTPSQLPYDPPPAGLLWKRISLEGIFSAAATTIGSVYLETAHSIGSGMAWLVFLFALSSFILSIFASVKQNRLWFIVTIFAFILLQRLAAATAACVTNPCPLR